MITAEHLRAAHDAAIASMDPSQARALEDMMNAAAPMRSSPREVERRLNAAFRKEAADLARQTHQLRS